MNTNVRVLITCGLLAGLPVSGCSSVAELGNLVNDNADDEGQASRLYADEVCMFADETNPIVSFRNVLFIIPTTAVVTFAKERGLVRVDNALCNAHVVWGGINLDDEGPRISAHSHTSRVRSNERCVSVTDPENGDHHLLSIMPARILNPLIPGNYIVPSLACDAHVGWVMLKAIEP